MLKNLVRLAGIVVVAVSFSVSAQGYPNKPVRLIVPYAPGGGTDVLARMIAQRLTEALDQSVVVDNRAGVDGIVGAEIMARAAPEDFARAFSGRYAPERGAHTRPASGRRTPPPGTVPAAPRPRCWNAPPPPRPWKRSSPIALIG